MIALTNLDPRVNDEVRMKLSNDVTEWRLAGEGQNTRLGESMTEVEIKKITQLLIENKDLFAWTAEDMSDIDPRVMSHKLSVCKEARPVDQKKKRMGDKKRIVAATKVQKLPKAGFIKEIQYTTWLANVVLVKKSNGQWRMRVDYTDLNKACPKDAYPLPSTDRLVDGTADNKMLSFLEAFFGCREDNIHYGGFKLLLSSDAFRFEKCRFLGFMLTHRGIEANPNKCSTILAMRSPTTLKEVQSLVGKLTSLSRFLPRLAEKIRPIVKTLKKANKFKWSNEYEVAFEAIKAVVSSAPIL